MGKKKKIFAFSDAHGHCSILKEELKKAGFEEGNKDHLLIGIGDYFERGEESLELYLYLRSLKDQVICLYGNHERFLQDFLNGPTSMFNYMYNGFDKTLDSFLQQTAAYPMYTIVNADKKGDLWYEFSKEARDEINNNYPDLKDWLNNLPYYYETKNYIFTHGTIDGKCADWKNPDTSWKELIWAKPYEFFHSIKNTDKTVVVGHINSGLIRGDFLNGDSKDNSILIREDGKKICLDTCTILTKKINILVIEDELLEEES